MFELMVTSHFSAAHALRNYQGKCEHMHGHNWKVEAVLRADDVAEDGMVLDFHQIREMLEGVLEGIDHKNLNDVAPFDKINPTTENVARYIYNELKSGLPEGVHVARVTSFETDGSGATYFED